MLPTLYWLLALCFQLQAHSTLVLFVVILTFQIETCFSRVIADREKLWIFGCKWCWLIFIGNLFLLCEPSRSVELSMLPIQHFCKICEETAKTSKRTEGNPQSGRVTALHHPSFRSVNDGKDVSFGLIYRQYWKRCLFGLIYHVTTKDWSSTVHLRLKRLPQKELG